MSEVDESTVVAEHTPTVCSRCGSTGGRFRLRGDGWVCVPGCSVEGNRDSARSTFPFTTTNIDGSGKPLEVQNLRHLRYLEREYGVNSIAYNQNVSNH